MSTNDIYSGERLSFLDLFNKKGYRVEIPIIQRDYAQGRSSSAEIRNIFLDALYTYLDEGKPHRDLDFVYGSIISEPVKTFIPLDGQQRLTTLFLLHWYLGCISGNSSKFRGFLLAKDHAKFSYQTRTSSTEFCDALVKFDFNIGELLPPDKEKSNSLSKTIQDCGWYYLAWQNDPTIKSMLTMLDAIHIRFKDRPEFFDSLADEQSSVITFMALNLKEFKLTDDLYIKMNSRGKPLTSFENFKAKFEQHIGQITRRIESPCVLEFDGVKRKVSEQEYFSYQIDTKWSNLFWNYRNTKVKYSSFDSELMNFIRVIVTNQHAMESTNNKDEILEYLVGAKKVKDQSDELTFHRYDSLGVLTPGAITYLIEAFDKLCNDDKRIHTYLSPDSFFPEDPIFERAIAHNLTFEQRVQFHAYLRFLIIHNKSGAGFEQWMRVVHNLTVNTVIDSTDRFSRAIAAVEQLLLYSTDILGYLESQKPIAFFYSIQIQEEQLKAHLIKRSAVWENAITRLEKHRYFLGQIMFALEFSEILAYYVDHGNCDWVALDDMAFLERFNNYAQKTSAAFQFIFSGDNDNFIWERATLTKGDYTITSGQRRNFLSSPDKFNRDYSWKRLLRLPEAGLDDKELQKKRACIKEVLDDPNFDAAKLKTSLQTIVKVIPDNWRRYFVKNPELLHYSKQGFIRFETWSNIRIFKESQQNHYQVELYSYNLFLNDYEGKPVLSPFNNCWYEAVRSGDEWPGIKFRGYSCKRREFGMDVYFDPAKEAFLIEFFKAKGIKTENEFPEELLTTLKRIDFQWDDESSRFFVFVKKDKDVVAKIEALCEELSQFSGKPDDE
ncbi:GmrSD restriction endonuclease domain-containing protein [Mucilaginibacter sp.]